eukprot:6187375-Pleurochrysis_carterae.AAC.1
MHCWMLLILEIASCLCIFDPAGSLARPRCCLSLFCPIWESAHAKTRARTRASILAYLVRTFAASARTHAPTRGACTRARHLTYARTLGNKETHTGENAKIVHACA